MSVTRHSHPVSKYKQATVLAAQFCKCFSVAVLSKIFARVLESDAARMTCK